MGSNKNGIPLASLIVKKDVVIPRLGSSDDADEARILRSLEDVGDSVEKGEGLLEVETDKVTVEIEAPSAGVLLQQKAEQDQFAKFNEVIEAQD
jgi:pyruvate dehydrogenase E2 component (dihydrolipoamide acetyltransferase)